MSRRYGEDDLIDFPCSNTWLGYYHEMGLTPRKPAEPDRTAEVLKATDQLRIEIVRLREAIERRPVQRQRTQAVPIVPPPREPERRDEKAEAVKGQPVKGVEI